MKKGNKKLLIGGLCFLGILLGLVGAFLSKGGGAGQLYLLTALGCLLIAGICFLKWFQTRK